MDPYNRQQYDLSLQPLFVQINTRDVTHFSASSGRPNTAATHAARDTGFKMAPLTEPSGLGSTCVHMAGGRREAGATSEVKQYDYAKII